MVREHGLLRRERDEGVERLLGRSQGDQRVPHHGAVAGGLAVAGVHVLSSTVGNREYVTYPFGHANGDTAAERFEETLRRAAVNAGRSRQRMTRTHDTHI